MQSSGSHNQRNPRGRHFGVPKARGQPRGTQSGPDAGSRQTRDSVRPAPAAAASALLLIKFNRLERGVRRGVLRGTGTPSISGSALTTAPSAETAALCMVPGTQPERRSLRRFCSSGWIQGNLKMIINRGPPPPTLSPPPLQAAGGVTGLPTPPACRGRIHRLAAPSPAGRGRSQTRLGSLSGCSARVEEPLLLQLGFFFFFPPLLPLSPRRSAPSLPPSTRLPPAHPSRAGRPRSPGPLDSFTVQERP